MNQALPCYPSVREHRTISLLPSDTLLNIDGYVNASETSPHYHPDATLTPSGVSFSAASGPKGNITMTSLRRIVRGLDGEELAPTDEELAELNESRLRGMLEANGSSRSRDGTIRGVLKNGYTNFDGDEEEEQVNGTVQNDWVDAEEYALAQEEIVGEVGDRGTGTVVDQGPDAEPPQLEDGAKRKYTEAEKEARKAEKRQRKRAEQSKKEQRRAAGN